MEGKNKTVGIERRIGQGTERNRGAFRKRPRRL